MRLSLEPVQYYWPKEQLLSFYEEIIPGPVDIVYLGETVCSKRRSLSLEEWFGLGQRLQDAGKEVVMSTLTLIEAASEQSAMRRLCKESPFLVEAGEQGAIEQLSSLGKTFTTGSAVNIYNQHTLALLAKLGLKRWVFPVELSRETLADMQKQRPTGVATEVFVWGRLPLAYAARCFTARSLDLPKDDCQLRCLDYPNGLLLKTREDEKFLCLNGIQTQSALTCNLLAEVEEMKQLDVDVLRISPQADHTARVIEAFSEAIHNTGDPAQLDVLIPSGACNGYWHGEAGMSVSPAAPE